jgi:hypothetical protein
MGVAAWDRLKLFNLLHRQINNRETLRTLNLRKVSRTRSLAD